ncbi:MAG: 3-hydroxyacyl-CoA dehydrogenase [Candidatus Competibacteraceae bacterium]|jgi:NAD(P)-dependent dehydrogenase (short-subunit alcohol dehydrogenase family)|nr:3-hydroxyacyl-CoA dehydrogenase [Candidatus Competibacteraceae bacterium]
MDIQNKTFLVTGGGSGLGGAAVQMLATNGANVIIADVNHETGEQLAAELGDQVKFIATDVSSETDVQAAVDSAVNNYGGLHGAINCAGIAVISKVLGKDGTPHSLASFTKGVQVNLIGTFNVIRLAAQVMSQGTPDAQGERGVIVNTASVAAFDGQIGQACYSATKAGIVGMTLPIAREMARFGIRVVTVAPGLFETPMMASIPEPVRESLGKQVPFPSRLGRPAEFANLVKHIIENIMLNGEVIRLDGAIRMAAQ